MSRVKKSEILLREIAKGRAYQVFAVGDRAGSPVEDFLFDLNRKQPNEFKKLTARIDRLACSGHTHNKQIFRSLSNEGLFEIKTTGGGRVLAFFDEGRIVICTNGFVKKSAKTPSGVIDRANLWRKKYLSAKSFGAIKILSSGSEWGAK